MDEDEGNDGEDDAEPASNADFLFPEHNAGHGQQADLTRGVYLLKMQGQGLNLTKKVVIE